MNKPEKLRPFHETICGILRASKSDIVDCQMKIGKLGTCFLLLKASVIPAQALPEVIEACRKVEAELQKISFLGGDDLWHDVRTVIKDLERRLETAKEQAATEDGATEVCVCMTCGHSMRPDGTCFVCSNCGGTDVSHHISAISGLSTSR